MKKALSITMAVVIIISGILVGCSGKNNDKATTTANNGLEDNQNNYIMDTVEVTDKNGQTVTDKNGQPVTEDVFYKEVTDKNGNKVIAKLDDKGEVVTNKNGDIVTVPTTTEKHTTTTTTKPAKTTTMKNAGGTTEKQLTTIKPENDKVPSTSATGKEVKFSAKDQNTVKSMLEVPYLYQTNYENASGVIPTNVAAHAAVWMADREGLNTSTFASGTVVLDLFKFFGQTVVNFKTNCNEGKDNAPITYNASNDTFSIPRFETSKQKVSLTKIEYLGNNNYYKVTGTVTNAGGKTKVVAVIQRNLLDSTLGFSIKALKWS